MPTEEKRPSQYENTISLINETISHINEKTHRVRIEECIETNETISRETSMPSCTKIQEDLERILERLETIAHEINI